MDLESLKLQSVESVSGDGLLRRQHFPSSPHSVKGRTHAYFGRGDGGTRKSLDAPFNKGIDATHLDVVLLV